nr:hypothetical protein [Candidatus Sigynarchaeota archaeon]
MRSSMNFSTPTNFQQYGFDPYGLSNFGGQVSLNLGSMEYTILAIAGHVKD